MSKAYSLAVAMALFIPFAFALVNQAAMVVA